MKLKEQKTVTRAMSGTSESEPLKTWQLDPRTAKRSSEFRSLYTNFVAVNLAQHEVSLVVCEIAPHANGPEMTELVRLMMSPSFARVLAATLAKNVQAWDQAFGGAGGTRSLPEPSEEGQKKK